ncbi:MAG: hypothetical protein WC886_06595 [Saccharofermentanaceae bacterium]|jgi:hypothetical protein
MRIYFYVNSDIWFEGNKDQFLKWVKLDATPKAGDTVQFDWGNGSKSEVFKIIEVVEAITGTISVYAQIKFE